MNFNLQLATKNIPTSIMDSDTITITRRTPNGNGTFEVSTIFTGACDYQQSDAGDVFYDPDGAVQAADAIVVIEANALLQLLSAGSGNVVGDPIEETKVAVGFTAILVGDVATITQAIDGLTVPILSTDSVTPETFLVVGAMLYTTYPQHLELSLKRGPVDYKSGKG